jgi:hypothetical protein
MALAWERNVFITTPQMGQAFSLHQPDRGYAWWLEVETQGAEERLAN